MSLPAPGASSPFLGRPSLPDHQCICQSSVDGSPHKDMIDVDVCPTVPHCRQSCDHNQPLKNYQTQNLIDFPGHVCSEMMMIMCSYSIWSNGLFCRELLSHTIGFCTNGHLFGIVRKGACRSFYGPGNLILISFASFLMKIFPLFFHKFPNFFKII